MSEINKDLLAPLAGSGKEKFTAYSGAEYVDAFGNVKTEMCELSVVLGQRNEEFGKAIARALDGLTGTRGYNEAKQRLYKYFDDTTNNSFKAYHLASSGGESVENAVRIAKAVTKRTEVVSFWNSIHGRTWLSGSMSGAEKRKKHYGPLAQGTVLVPYPDCSHCPFKENGLKCELQCYDEAMDIIRYGSAQDTAAIFVELWQANGVINAPKEYVLKLRSWAKENGVIFVVDEMQTGMGRCGDYYLYQEYGLDPDIVLIGKALGNGFHISALMTKILPPDDMLSVYAGGSGDDPVACAAACEVFRQLDGGLLDNINKCGSLLKSGFQEIREKYPDLVSAADAKGLSGSLVFRNGGLCSKVVSMLDEKGFYTGHANDFLFVKPPYVINEKQISNFIITLDKVLADLGQ